MELEQSSYRSMWWMYLKRALNSGFFPFIHVYRSFLLAYFRLLGVRARRSEYVCRSMLCVYDRIVSLRGPSSYSLLVSNTGEAHAFPPCPADGGTASRDAYRIGRDAGLGSMDGTKRR